MKAAGMKVLRTWVTGHQAGQKGSSNKYVPDVEQNGLRQYDDTLLDQIDQLMVCSPVHACKIHKLIYAF